MLAETDALNELDTDWLTTLDALADTEADCKALILAETDCETFTDSDFLADTD